MYGRKELYPIDGVVCTKGKDYLNKEKADKVMDAMEAKIKELECTIATLTRKCESESAKATEWGNDLLFAQARIKELETDAELDQKKRLILCKGYNKKCEKVKELESENERLMAEMKAKER